MKRLRKLFLPAVLALCMLATACGGSSGGDGAGGVASAGYGSTAKSSDGKKKADPQKAGLDFARCMREHGVDVPDPKSGEGGMVMIGPGPADGAATLGAEPPAGFEEANKACRHFLEDLVRDGGAAVDPKEQDRALKFTQCMRKNGVNMPDPDFSKGGVQIEIGGEGFDPMSETFKAAQKACGSLFGPGGAGASPAPGIGARS